MRCLKQLPQEHILGLVFNDHRELLSRYQAASSRISVRTIDPDRNPAEEHGQHRQHAA